LGITFVVLAGLVRDIWRTGFVTWMGVHRRTKSPWVYWSGFSFMAVMAFAFGVLFVVRFLNAFVDNR
jgi:hypothetical protein